MNKMDTIEEELVGYNLVEGNLMQLIYESGLKYAIKQAREAVRSFTAEDNLDPTIRGGTKAFKEFVKRHNTH